MNNPPKHVLLNPGQTMAKSWSVGVLKLNGSPLNFNKSDRKKFKDFCIGVNPLVESIVIPKGFFEFANGTICNNQFRIFTENAKPYMVIIGSDKALNNIREVKKYIKEHTK